MNANERHHLHVSKTTDEDGKELFNVLASSESSWTKLLPPGPHKNVEHVFSHSFEVNGCIALANRVTKKLGGKWVHVRPSVVGYTIQKETTMDQLEELRRPLLACKALFPPVVKKEVDHSLYRSSLSHEVRDQPLTRPQIRERRQARKVARSLTYQEIDDLRNNRDIYWTNKKFEELGIKKEKGWKKFILSQLGRPLAETLRPNSKKQWESRKPHNHTRIDSNGVSTELRNEGPKDGQAPW